MEPSDMSAVRRAWEMASRELGIRIETADCWLGPADDPRRYELVAIVRDFGRGQGTAVLQEWEPSARELAESQGFFATRLSRSYEAYDRALFEDTLNDWQWTGEGEPPSWYTGDPWSE